VVPEAPLEQTETGVVPTADGWFVLNARDARWYASAPMGFHAVFEAEGARFHDLGLNLNVLRPDEPMSLYHGEDAQEDFLVLAGECVLVIEGQERKLATWDFVHCPPWTEHVFVGAGEGSCLVLAVGARSESRSFRYPANEVASRYGASAEKDTTDPREAYATFDRPVVVSRPPEFDELASRS
jgi:uncharacterized cupin superfamily protein